MSQRHCPACGRWQTRTRRWCNREQCTTKILLHFANQPDPAAYAQQWFRGHPLT